MKYCLIVFAAVLLTLASCSGDSGNSGEKDVHSASDSLWSFDKKKAEDSSTTDLGSQDVKDQEPDVSPEGWLAYCQHNDNCAIFGLKCFTAGPNDPRPICSKECQVNSDCPDGLNCNFKGSTKVCRDSSFCDNCGSNSDCTPPQRCLPDGKGGLYCSGACDIKDNDFCGPGAWCIEDSFGPWCRPIFGTCRQGGQNCAQCIDDWDCAPESVCHMNQKTKERFCSRICQTKQECHPQFGCYTVLGAQNDLCILEFGGVASESCMSGTKTFCMPCLFDLECRSGVCYQSPFEPRRYACSFACDHDTWPKTGGCPSGLSCVNNFNSGSRAQEVCMPPSGIGCQGFLNCRNVQCAAGEICRHGFCEPK